jgi:hypothetical protein
MQANQELMQLAKAQNLNVRTPPCFILVQDHQKDVVELQKQNPDEDCCAGSSSLIPAVPVPLQTAVAA